jgi:hypothetical protein
VTAVGGARPTLRLFTVFERFSVAGGINPTARDYYDPTNTRGEQDGAIAFAYCADTLKQPPNTYVFFAIDWGEDPLSAQGEDWIAKYVKGINTAYDAYLTTHPNRPYLIGIYGRGSTLRVCYNQGIASGLWQAASVCTTESEPPRWPWPHATRWQYDGNIPVAIGGIGLPDPDADWGDGGDWSITDPLNTELILFENASFSDILSDLSDPFGGLLIPSSP